MTDDRRLPSFEARDLRDYSTSAAVDRVWQRLELSLDERPQPRSRRPAVLWAAAAAAATFAGGIWVGRNVAAPEPSTVAMVSAEPSQQGGLAWSEPRLEPTPVLPEAKRAERDEPERVVRGVRSGRLPSLPSSAAPAEASPQPDGVEPVATGDGLEPLAPSLEGAPPNGAGVSSEPPRWQRLANRGEYEAASFELSQAGGFESVLGSASPEQLMLLVDVARATGQRQRAISALRRVVSEFPSDPNAPIAAWSLGTLLEKSGDKRGANEAFAAYRALSPQGDFAEDALVRQLRSAVQRRERDLARELASQYANDFPGGARSDEVARWLVVLEAAGADGDADAGAPEEPVPSEVESPIGPPVDHP